MVKKTLLHRIKNKLDFNKVILVIMAVTLLGTLLVLLETRQAIDELKTPPQQTPSPTLKQSNYLEVMLSNEEAKKFVEDHPDYKADVETLEEAELDAAKKKYPVLYADVESNKVYKIMLSSESSSQVLLVIQDDTIVLNTFPVTKISIG